MRFLVASPLCVSVLKLEISRHESFITQSVAILQNVLAIPSLTTSLMHVSGIGTAFSTAAQCSDGFAV